MLNFPLPPSGSNATAQHLNMFTRHVQPVEFKLPDEILYHRSKLASRTIQRQGLAQRPGDPGDLQLLYEGELVYSSPRVVGGVAGVPAVGRLVKVRLAFRRPVSTCQQCSKETAL